MWNFWTKRFTFPEENFYDEGILYENLSGFKVAKSRFILAAVQSFDFGN